MDGKRTLSKYVKRMIACGLALTLACPAGISGIHVDAAKKRTVKVGSIIRIKSNWSKPKYKSANNKIASVDQNGIVTGKKAGTTKISVKAKNGRSRNYMVHVKKRKKKPSVLQVAWSDIQIKGKRMDKKEDGSYTYSFRIKNNSKSGKIKKIILFYNNPASPAPSDAGNVTEAPAIVPTAAPAAPTAMAEVTAAPTLPASTAAVSSGTAVSTQAPGASQTQQPLPVLPEGTAATMLPLSTEDVSVVGLNDGQSRIVVKNIKKGKTSKRVYCSGLLDGDIAKMKPVKVMIYSGNSVFTYYPQKKKAVFQWGKDTKAPVFKGLIKKKSYKPEDIYRVYYSDKKNTYNFKQFVTAVDDRDGKVPIQVDTSKINWNKSGVYRIWYKAKDRAENVSKTWAKVQVYKPGTVERAADRVLASITRKSWSDAKKARAIYRYARGHMTYVHNSPHSQWRVSALRSFRYSSGNCYNYYSLSRTLLTRAGIPNMMIKRYPTPRGMKHYWNLVYVNGGWYHFDTTPRTRNANFCLLTDDQMFHYSSGYTFQFKRSLYPARAKKHISPTP